MQHYPQPMGELIGELTKLPGIGPKTAQRLAFHILGLKKSEVKRQVKKLQVFKLIQGYRNSDKKNLDKLSEAVVNLAKLARDYPYIQELDINPLFLNKNKAIAADVRIIS